MVAVNTSADKDKNGGVEYWKRAVSIGKGRIKQCGAGAIWHDVGGNYAETWD